MPTIDHLRTLYDYHFDTTLRLITAAQGLTEAHQVGEEGHSIHDLLFHILGADRGWRIGLETGRRPLPLQAEDYPDLAALKCAFEEEKLAWSRLLAGLDAGYLGQDIEIQAGPDRLFTFAWWKVLHHVVLHGMQHHAEIAERLTRAGMSPGDIDFIFYVWPSP
jgi:uncharacterized damage-inducible protein DinB